MAQSLPYGERFPKLPFCASYPDDRKMRTINRWNCVGSVSPSVRIDRGFGRQESLLSRLCPVRRSLSSIAKKAGELKNDSHEYLNCAQEADRYKRMIHQMRKLSDLEKALIGLVSLGREKSLPVHRASIFQELKKSSAEYEWASFSDGTIFCAGFTRLGGPKTTRRRT